MRVARRRLGVLGIVAALVFGTVSLAQGSDGAPNGGRTTRTVTYAGPITLARGQRAVLWVANVSAAARSAGMQLLDGDGKVLEQATRTIPAGHGSSIIAILIGLRAQAGTVRARVTSAADASGAPFVIGSLYAQADPTSPSRLVDGTSNTILIGLSSTPIVHATKGDTGRVLVANMASAARTFTVTAFDGTGRRLGQKTIGSLASGATGSVSFLFGDGSVRFVVDGTSNTRYAARAELTSTRSLLPFIEQEP